MKTSVVIFSGIAATSVMTLFSYMASRATGRNFNEPELLADMATKLLPQQQKALGKPAGWSFHYSIGTIWALTFREALKITKRKPASMNALLGGVTSGAIGTIVWHAIFKVHPEPPRIPHRSFYIQLMAAHVVYSLSFAALLQREKKNRLAYRRLIRQNFSRISL